MIGTKEFAGTYDIDTICLELAHKTLTDDLIYEEEMGKGEQIWNRQEQGLLSPTNFYCMQIFVFTISSSGKHEMTRNIQEG